MLSSCEEKQEWGIKKIYMPQAAIANNINHEYPVPMTGQQDKNYSVEDGKLNIFLGVYRSGQGDLRAYSVDIYHDAAASSSAAGTGNRVAVPQNYLTYPSQVSVADGQRQNTFLLSIDLESLKAEHPEYAEKELIVVIGIANPTLYELNEDISKTTIVIDGSVFI